MKIKQVIAAFLSAILMLALFSGCSNMKDEPTALSETPGPVSGTAVSADQYVSESMTDAGMPEPKGGVYEMPKAEAAGKLTDGNEKCSLDYSNTEDGYVMVKYLGKNTKVKVQLTGPSSVTYTYNLSLTGEWDVLPLSDGSGSYKLGVYENISGTKYSTAFTKSMNVTLSDEFEPFLRSNKYVNIVPGSKAEKLAAELTSGLETTPEKVREIYLYVINNISYDYDLAANVKSGYIPVLDDVLAAGKGICFDYAALMAGMLRTCGVPTKLVVGYAGEAYHAWINTYSQESGWVEASIYFDGKQWKLMDPTYASNGKGREDIIAYIGNGANYVAKYLY